MNKLKLGLIALVVLILLTVNQIFNPANIRKIPEEYRYELAYVDKLRIEQACMRELQEDPRFSELYETFSTALDERNTEELQAILASDINERFILPVLNIALAYLEPTQLELVQLVIDNGIALYDPPECGGNGGVYYYSINDSDEIYDFLLNSIDVELLGELDIVEYFIEFCEPEKLEQILVRGVRSNKLLAEKYEVSIIDFANYYCLDAVPILKQYQNNMGHPQI